MDAILILALIGLYFLPGAVAELRGHRNAKAIGALNLIFGWTLLGWGIALVWALTEARSSGSARSPM